MNRAGRRPRGGLRQSVRASSGARSGDPSGPAVGWQDSPSPGGPPLFVVLKALTIFSGNANRELAQAICRYVETPLGRAEVTRFADGEVYVEINENVRGVNCFVVQPTCAPVNDNLMELLVMIDALKRASAGSIIAVIPYFGYARQDRKSKPRTPISARLVADLLTAAGVDRVLSIDLHAGQIQGFFNIPVDHLYAHAGADGRPARRASRSEAVIVSPDAGGVERARAYSKRLGTSLAIIDKRRPAPNVSEVVNIIGDVKGRDAIIVDDMIDTAGTLCAAAQAVKAPGRARGLRLRQPRRALAAGHRAHHGLAAGGALITDTIPLRPDVRGVPEDQGLPSRASWARPSNASTTATRSARCSSENARTPKEAVMDFAKVNVEVRTQYRQGRRAQGARRRQGSGRPLRPQASTRSP